MTDQQKQIKDNLISLVRKGVRIEFSDGIDRCSKEIAKSSVISDTHRNRTLLILSKDDSLDEWERLIQDAEHTEAQRVLEREHEYQSPNFFRAISAFINDNQKFL